MKYIIFDNIFPVIFSNAIPHDCAARGIQMPPTSAGFCELLNGKLIVGGRSESLDLDSTDDDAKILNDCIGIK